MSLKTDREPVEVDVYPADSPVYTVRPTLYVIHRRDGALTWIHPNPKKAQHPRFTTRGHWRKVTPRKE